MQHRSTCAAEWAKAIVARHLDLMMLPSFVRWCEVWRLLDLNASRMPPTLLLLSFLVQDYDLVYLGVRAAIGLSVSPRTVRNLIKIHHESLWNAP